jgi:hypothetical protein
MMDAQRKIRAESERLGVSLGEVLDLWTKAGSEAAATDIS